MQRFDPDANSYSAMMLDVITNAHRYTPKVGDWVMDAGAHYGVFSLFCAARGAEVQAFEPIRDNFVELQHSVEMAEEIGIGRITPFQCAVWDKTSIIPMWKFPSKPCFSTVSRPQEADLGIKDRVAMQQTQAIAFDEALGDAYFKCVKLDIEGAEHRVLMSCRKFRQIEFLTVEIHNDILSLDECDEIDALLRDSFSQIDRLPVKKNPAQTVAYFCRGGK